MEVMRLVWLVLVAGCWRGVAAPMTRAPEPLSFVVRINGLADLQRSTAVLETKLATATQRFLGLADEAQRDALRDDLRMLADDLAQLAARVRTVRMRGGNTTALYELDRRLAVATITLAELRHGLRYATTLEQLQANLPTELPEHPHLSHISVADVSRP
jgi:hypothetical protein